MQFKKLPWVMTAVLLAASLSSCNIGKAPEPTQDVNAIYTAAAGTMLAQFGDQMTQTAQAIPPTPAESPTPLATFTSLPTFSVAPGTTPFGAAGTQFVFNTPAGAGTPLPTLSTGGSTGSTSSTAVGCSDSAYVTEASGSGFTVDGDTVASNKKFSVGFQMANTGTCSWDQGYSFVFVSGDQMNGNNILIKSGDRVTAPGNSNTFIVNFQAPAASGDYKSFWRMKDDKGNLFGQTVYIQITVK